MPCQWLQYADYEMDPIRRSRRGSITPLTNWILYADHGMDPTWRSVTQEGGALAALAFFAPVAGPGYGLAWPVCRACGPPSGLRPGRVASACGVKMNFSGATT